MNTRESEDDTESAGELMEASVNSALVQITKGEIDQQIETAHRHPRSVAKFQKRALEMVTLDEETAESCIYSRPVGKKNGVMQFAEGKSIRMAEIVGACYGNLRVGSMLVEMTDRYVKARGMAHDLESNFASQSEVVESTVDRNGNPYSERMRIVVAKAALAKARRYATFAVVPGALCKKIEAEARKTAIGDASTLAKRRGQVMQWIGKLGIDQARVFATLGIEGEADIGLDELTQLTGLKTAIKDGDATVDETFPPLERTVSTRAEAAKDLLKGKDTPENKGADKTPPPADVAKDPNYVAHYDEKNAVKAIKAAATDEALNKVVQEIKDDYAKSGRALPPIIDPTVGDRREAIKQAGGQLKL